MLESMTGAVGFAMHEDRLAKAASNLRLLEAEQAGRGQQARSRRSCRATIAGMLTALATRLAPTVTAGTAATAR